MKPFAPLILCALALAACASGGRGPGGGPGSGAGASAGPTLRPAGLLIASFDADGDYRVTREEIAAGARRAFPAADTDGDGGLSLIELADWRGRAFGDRAGLPGPYGFDADQDGVIAPGEFEAEILDTAWAYADAAGAVPFSALIQTRAERAGGRSRDDDFWTSDGERARRPF